MLMIEQFLMESNPHLYISIERLFQHKAFNRRIGTNYLRDLKLLNALGEYWEAIETLGSLSHQI